MLLAPLLVTALTLAPTGVQSRLELDVGTDVAIDSWRYPPPPGFTEIPGGHSTGGDASAGLTVYVHRIVDDDAPPALQPYLQRASFLHIAGGGGGYDATNPSSPLPTSSGHGGGVDLSAVGYSRGWLFGSLGFSVRYNELDGASGAKLSSSIVLPLSASVGVRVGALRLDAGWSVTPRAVDDAPFKVDFWGGAYARAFGVVRNQLALGATVQVLDGGAFVNGDATLYLARRFGVAAFVHGAHSSPSARDIDRAGAGVGFEAWMNARFALRFDYSLDWYRYALTPTSIEQQAFVSVISLRALIRPR